MSLEQLITSFPWTRYSKRLSSKIEKPRSAGFFTQEDARERGVHFAEGQEGSLEDGNFIHLFWLVSIDDGVILDAKFQVFGQSALIGAAEIACELLIGKNYDQARRMSTTLIDQQVRDKPEVPAFPVETIGHLNLVLGAIDQAAEQCLGLPLPHEYAVSPVPRELRESEEGVDSGWVDLDVGERLRLVEAVLDQDVRPYIALDAGGVEVLKITDNHEIHIAYKGSCTSCYSSVGTTLSYIQQILRTRLYVQIVVIPQI